MGQSRSRLDLRLEVERGHQSDAPELCPSTASPRSVPEDTSHRSYRMARARKGFHYLRSRSGLSISGLRKTPSSSKNSNMCRDPVGRTMAHHACKFGDVALREVAKMGVALNGKDNAGVTPAHVAAEHGQSECLETLHELRVSLEERDLYGQTPAHYAVWHGHLDVVQTLFKLGINLEVEDEDSRTPAHYAARNKDVGMLQLLTQCGVCMAKRDSRGMLPEHYSPVAFEAIKRFSNAKFARDSAAEASDSAHAQPTKGMPRAESVPPRMADNALDADYLERLHSQAKHKHRRRGMLSSEIRPSQLRAFASPLPSTVEKLNEEAEVIDAPLPSNGRKDHFALRSTSTATTASSLSSPRQPCDASTRTPLTGERDGPSASTQAISPRCPPTSSDRPDDGSDAIQRVTTLPAQWGESEASLAFDPCMSAPWKSEHSAWVGECSNTAVDDPLANVFGDTLGYEIGHLRVSFPEEDTCVPFVPKEKKLDETVAFSKNAPTPKNATTLKDAATPKDAPTPKDATTPKNMPTLKDAMTLSDAATPTDATTPKDATREFASVKERINKWLAMTNA